MVNPRRQHQGQDLEHLSELDQDLPVDQDQDRQHHHHPSCLDLDLCFRLTKHSILNRIILYIYFNICHVIVMSVTPKESQWYLPSPAAYFSWSTISSNSWYCFPFSVLHRSFALLQHRHVATFPHTIQVLIRTGGTGKVRDPFSRYCRYIRVINPVPPLSEHGARCPTEELRIVCGWSRGGRGVRRPEVRHHHHRLRPLLQQEEHPLRRYRRGG
mmetsp:Transcript_34836/g.70465  ORF Transcript_34836/g.70465 Transcript_34836/m.70465 type:complete len:214 (+) Transcript_34836:2487-3128(+)